MTSVDSGSTPPRASGPGTTGTGARRTAAVTWNYLCPFARNAHEHLVAAIAAGLDWEVEFLPFSLSETHVEEGGASVFDDPEAAPEMLSMCAGIVVRDRFPEAFYRTHLGLFAARHDLGLDIRSREVVTAVLGDAGLDAASVLKEVDDGWPIEAFALAHRAAVADHEVFGVPTFVVGDDAAFVRLMTRPGRDDSTVTRATPTGPRSTQAVATAAGADGSEARRTIERVLDLLVSHPELNEFKHTTVSR
jgi:hypothetical protein